MKHVQRRHFFVRDMVESHEIEVPFVRTHDNISDFLTKPMNPDKFFKFRDYFASQGRPFARIGSVGEMTEESLYRGGNTIDLDALQSAFPFG